MNLRSDTEKRLPVGAVAATNRLDVLPGTATYSHPPTEVLLSKIAFMCGDAVSLTWPFKEIAGIEEPSRFFVVPVTIAEATASAPSQLSSEAARLVFHHVFQELEGWFDRDSAITSLDEQLDSADVFDQLATHEAMRDLQFSISHLATGVVFDIDVDLEDLPEKTIEVGEWDFESWDD